MPKLENDELIFRFPSIDPYASFSISFQRTLRVPDTGNSYPLPAGLGIFPLCKTDDYLSELPDHVRERGGVFLPMWPSEALWINLNNNGINPDTPFPVAVKIATGKVNAISGDPWTFGLERDPQDYVVSPDQLWIDGYLTEEGGVRQFVAMEISEQSTVEEQITGRAKWGGLQISVAPLKKEVWRQQRARKLRIGSYIREELTFVEPLGIAAGGSIRQPIYRDPFDEADWDVEATDRVFISIVNAKNWQDITRFPAPTAPPDAAFYSESGLPWFEYYGKDQDTLIGTPKLKSLTSKSSNSKNQSDENQLNEMELEIKSVKEIDSRSLGFLRISKDED